jgi:hypothetical protein
MQQEMTVFKNNSYCEVFYFDYAVVVMQEVNLLSADQLLASPKSSKHICFGFRKSEK